MAKFRFLPEKPNNICPKVVFSLNGVFGCPLGRERRILKKGPSHKQPNTIVMIQAYIKEEDWIKLLELWLELSKVILSEGKQTIQQQIIQ